MFVSWGCYLDDSNGAAVASRAMMQALARHGLVAEVLCGPVLDLVREEGDLAGWLAARGRGYEECRGRAWGVDSRGLGAEAPRHFRLSVQGISINVYPGISSRPHEPEASEREAFLRLFEGVMDRLRPDVLVGYGGDPVACAVRERARARGVAVVFILHNFHYFHPRPFADADAVIAPSLFAADYYREALGLECEVLPNVVDFARVRAERPDPRYVTFVNPSIEKGVYAFARIADELGRRRPDIPLLVVEGRGTEATLARCGLDLRAHGNVHLMAHTPDPRRFWGVTRIALAPRCGGRTNHSSRSRR